jgi:hypothetical protein
MCRSRVLYSLHQNHQKKDEVGETYSMHRTDEKHNPDWKTSLKETGQGIRKWIVFIWLRRGTTLLAFCETVQLKSFNSLTLPISLQLCTHFLNSFFNNTVPRYRGL